MTICHKFLWNVSSTARGTIRENSVCHNYSVKLNVQQAFNNLVSIYNINICTSHDYTVSTFLSKIIHIYIYHVSLESKFVEKYPEHVFLLYRKHSAVNNSLLSTQWKLFSSFNKNFARSEWNNRRTFTHGALTSNVVVSSSSSSFSLARPTYHKCIRWSKLLILATDSLITSKNINFHRKIKRNLFIKNKLCLTYIFIRKTLLGINWNNDTPMCELRS